MSELYICPLSKKIYYDPVVAEDGFIYERNELIKWLQKPREYDQYDQHSRNLSPTTGKYMGGRIQRAKKIKLLVDEYLEKNPERISDQYYYKVLYNKDEAIGYINTEEFERLYDYKDYWLNECTDIEGRVTFVEFLCDKCKDEDILKYVLSNSVDYDVPNFDGVKPITVLIIFCSTNIIKFMIEEMGISIEEPNRNGVTPLHTIIIEKGANEEFIKYLVGRKCNFELVDGAGNRCIHYFSRFGSIESIMAIGHLVDWNVSNDRGLKPIHLICKSWDKVKIDQILSLKEPQYSIKLDVVVEDGLDKTCLDILYDNKYLGREDKQFLIHKYLDRIKKTPIIDMDFLSRI